MLLFCVYVAEFFNCFFNSFTTFLLASAWVSMVDIALSKAFMYKSRSAIITGGSGIPTSNFGYAPKNVTKYSWNTFPNMPDDKFSRRKNLSNNFVF